MKNVIKKLKRAPWSFKQPLTKKPELSGLPVSDLFVWRKSEDWETYFELIDIAALFDEHIDLTRQYATIYLFDSNGVLFNKENIQLEKNIRQTINLNSFLKDAGSEYGTFSVFHGRTPTEIIHAGSFLAERGYVSYCYKEAPVRSYVHGNLDAITLYPEGELQLLGSRSLLPREYRLQYELSNPACYEIGVVNPTSSDVKLSCITLKLDDGEVMEIQKTKIKQRGTHVFKFDLSSAENAKVIIRSHLVMARPLVFRTENRNMDVFHG